MVYRVHSGVARIFNSFRSKLLCLSAFLCYNKPTKHVGVFAVAILKRREGGCMSKSKSPQVQADQKKTRTPVKTVVIGLFVALVLLGGMAFGGYLIFNHYYMLLGSAASDDSADLSTASQEPDEDFSLEDATPQEIEAQEAMILQNWESNKDKIVFSGDVYNILLIGSDARDANNPGRSDTMIIVSVNKKTEQVTLTSIMRDTYVHIPKVGFNRINAAIVFGGPSRLLETIDENFGIQIDNYVKVDFDAFTQLVDLVGGVDVTLTADEIKQINRSAPASDGTENEAPTTLLVFKDDDTLYHLNGKQALAYSRIRYVGNADFERTERQRDVLTKLIAKAKKLRVAELNALMKVALPLVSTNLTRSEMLSLLWNYVTAYNSYDIQSFRIPEDDTYEYLMIDGMSVLGIDFDKNMEDFRLKIEGAETSGTN